MWPYSGEAGVKRIHETALLKVRLGIPAAREEEGGPGSCSTHTGPLVGSGGCREKSLESWSHTFSCSKKLQLSYLLGWGQGGNMFLP